MSSGVERGPSCARVSVVAGTPRAISLTEPDNDSLGDLLLAAGALGQGAQTILQTDERDAATSGMPVGEWLVASGFATQQAVESALTLQLRRRLLRLFSFRDADYRFRAGNPDVGVPMLDVPVNVPDLVLGAMREAVASESITEVRKRIGSQPLELTPLGEHILHSADIDPSELAMVSMMRAGVTDVDVLLSATGGSLRAMRTLYSLKLVRAVSQPGPESYGLLLRKHRQVRRHAPPRALLDLPSTAAPTQARAALRKLARDLHPDRFHGTGSASARRISHEVLTALVSAEANLRTES